MAVAVDFHIEREGASGPLCLRGALDLYHEQEAKELLQEALSGQQAHTPIDLSGLTRLDTAGALLLKRFKEKHHLDIYHLRPEHAALFAMVAKAEVAPLHPPRKKPAWWVFLRQLGENTLNAWQWSINIVAFFGQACVTFLTSLRSLKHLRFADIMGQIEKIGIDAIPIIAAMAFMISVVIAYQGVAQLKTLGAESFTVNLVAISVLREMGVLLTAIMVAGRSGSAFTAEIGVMKVREEVDALQVIGINPFEVLVMPRLFALLIALPLLTFIADITGLYGGSLMSLFLIDIPFSTYMERVRTIAHGHDFLVGMIKAPVFAFIIAMVGCMHGLRVSGSAESVGRETTASVVKSIFLVLVVDAIFSIIFDKMGI